jgi:DnaJ homolog subfamily C member 19
MIWLLFGGLVVFALVAGLRAFERASVGSIKALLAWIAALGGLTLALLLILSGRGSAAIGALVMFGPLIWQRIRNAQMQSHARRQAAAGNAGAGPSGSGAGGGESPSGSGGWGPAPHAGGPMTKQEAYQVLGLRAGATEADIRDAHHRLMRRAHPDVGGSEWIATRINQARDVLLR